jgi:hypothetical protein
MVEGPDADGCHRGPERHDRNYRDNPHERSPNDRSLVECPLDRQGGRPPLHPDTEGAPSGRAHHGAVRIDAAANARFLAGNEDLAALVKPHPY